MLDIQFVLFSGLPLLVTLCAQTCGCSASGAVVQPCAACAAVKPCSSSQRAFCWWISIAIGIGSGGPPEAGSCWKCRRWVSTVQQQMAAAGGLTWPLLKDCAFAQRARSPHQKWMLSMLTYCSWAIASGPCLCHRSSSHLHTNSIQQYDGLLRGTAPCVVA